jgi:addiction module HigA family antidote
MNTLKQALSFDPDYAVPPGQLIEEYLRDRNMSARELARRCGRSPKLITEIILGKAPVEPETALQLERALNVDASIWLGFESEYRLRLARIGEDERLAEHLQWAKRFPFKSLAQRGLISDSYQGVSLVRAILRFFGAGSVDACKGRCRELINADFRTSPTFSSNLEPLAAWLRIGEIRASDTQTEPYDRNKFLQALQKIRTLTAKPIAEAYPEAARLCAEAGVVFVVEPPFEKVVASGVSWWLSPKKAVIQQSLRFKKNDHFWFTFFHEAAHILLHSRKAVFIDDNKGGGNVAPELEQQANDWAEEFLVPQAAMLSFLKRFRRTEDDVIAFANQLSIAPGIVVGQLQHRGVIRWGEMNGLRMACGWGDVVSGPFPFG